MFTYVTGCWRAPCWAADHAGAGGGSGTVRTPGSLDSAMHPRHSLPARLDPARRASLERQQQAARTSYRPRAETRPQPERSFLRATPAPRLPTPTQAPRPSSVPYVPSSMPRQPPVGTGAWVGPGLRGTAGATVGPDVKPAGAPTGAVETPGGAPSRIAPVSKLSTTRDASGKLVQRQQPLTRVKVDSVSSSFTDDGGDQNAVLTDDLTTFWESEDEGDPPEPWIVMMLSRLDVISGVYVRIDPRDEAEDLLPVEVSVSTGASAKSAQPVSRVTLDPKSDQLQPLIGPGITSGEWAGKPGAEEHEKFAITNQLLKQVFVVKLVFHGLRDEQEGHVRVRQVLVRSKGMTRETPRPASAASSAASATEENAGDSAWPSGRQTPSASHAAVLTPWKDKAAYRKFQREHPVASAGVPSRTQAERQRPDLNATVAPAIHWTTYGPKYRLKVKPLAVPEPIRSELDSLYSHPNASEETISQGIILMSQTAPGFNQEVCGGSRLEFDGRWDDDLSRRGRRRRAASRGSSRPRRSRSAGAGDQRGVAVWTEGDAMEMEWWGRVAQLAPKGDRRVSDQLGDAYRMMHGSSPFNDQDGEDIWQQQQELPLMGGMGDSYRSLLAAEGAHSVMF